MFSCPEFAAIVEIAGDLHAPLFGGLAGFLADLYEVFTKSRGDPREVEPIGTLKDRVPIEILGLCHLDGRIFSVVDTDRAALGSALFKIIDTDPLAAADDLIGIDTEVTKRIDRRLSDGVGGELGHVGAIKTKIGKRYGDVRLPAAKGGLHLIILEKAVVAVRSQPQHDFTKGYNSHDYSPFCAIASRASLTKKLPPMAATLSKARNSSMLPQSTPPVGINFTCGKGAERALSALRPP